MDPASRIAALVVLMGDGDVVLGALGLERPDPWSGAAGLAPDADTSVRLPVVEEILLEARCRLGPPAARRWALAPSPALGGTRPVDALARGRWRAVRRALRAESVTGQPGRRPGR